MPIQDRFSYLPVPTIMGANWRPSLRSSNERRCIHKRSMRAPVLLLISLVALYALMPQHLLTKWMLPNYEGYRNREDRLPHYSLDSPYPNGRRAKFILFANHQKGVGWGNVMQEIVLNAFLAYSTKRSFVFYDYSWNMVEGLSTYDGRYIPSNTPLSAILSGPLVGGLIHSPDAPQAVSEIYFRKVCPNTTIVRREDLEERLRGTTFDQYINVWVEKLGSMEDRCIEIPKGTPQVFDYLIFGSKKVLEVWPALSQSPVIKQLGWSPLVHSAFNTNRHLFQPQSPKTPPTTQTDEALSLPFPPLEGLLAIHIRHGDYVEHCKGLASWSSQFNGFNRFDELPDKLEVPEGGNTNIQEYYRKHCYPTISEIVSKVSSVRQKVSGLRGLYIMTNEQSEWVNELIRALRTSEKWDAISSTKDLSLTREQRYVSQALDMYVGQRARAFIGNGWSSLTSNVVMLRMAGEHHPNTTFFW
ncbi:hypothetical protein AX15_006958 [Amanita polypyramis BW_CC]|nr:hypothetical protein AX15_006958 [Amanita polypyramis BW_CC]